MNSKKITALALAALMAVGSTGTVFAEVTNGNALDFFKEEENAAATKQLYKEKDGVLKPVENYEFAPGDTIYIHLDEEAELKSADAKKMGLYATWKVGEDYVEDLDIVYKKAQIDGPKKETIGYKYTVTVDGKEVEVTVSKKTEKADLIKNEKVVAAITAAMEKYKVEKYNVKGNLYDTAAEAVAALGTYTDNQTFYKFGESDKLFLGADTTVAEFLVAAGFEKTDKTVFAGTATTTNGECVLDAGDGSSLDTEVTDTGDKYIKTVGEGASAKIYFVNVVKFADVDAVLAVKTDIQLTAIEVQDGYVKTATPAERFATAEDVLKAEKIEKEETYEKGDVVGEAAVKAAIEVDITASEPETVTGPGENYGYFAKIVTKSSTTTKTIDLAGTLYVGRSKSNAINNSETFDLDVTLSNRGGDPDATDYFAVLGADDSDCTINPGANAVVNFDGEAEEVVIEFGDSIGYFEFNAKGQKALNFAYTLDFNKEIADMFPDANLDFITWKAAPATNKTGTLYLYADEDTFIYELPSSSNAATAVLKEVKNAKYNEDEGAWEIRTRKLVGYVISDKELDVETVTVDSSASTGSSTGNNNSGKPNPDTGR